MSSSPREENRVPGLVAKSDADNTPVIIEADPITKRLKVNATITGSASDGSIVDGVDTGIKATVFDYTSSNPLGVVLRDNNGDYVSVGGGTQYTEDAASAANPVGTAVNLIRKDTPAGEVTTDGDNVAQRGTNYGAAYVTLLDTSGSPVSVGGGTQYDEDTASADAQKLTMAGVTRADTAATQVDLDGDRSTLIVDASGRLHANVGASALPTGAATSAKQDTGNTSLASIDGKITAVNTGAVTVSAALPAGTNNIGDVDVLSSALPTGASTSAKQDTGNTSLASIDGKITAVNTGAVVVSSSALPSGASTLAEQQTQTTALQLIDDVVYASDAAISKVAGIGAQFDDVAPGTTTENSVRSLRMSTRRELYNQIRDAAGNERGANVTAGNALVVDGSASTQPVSGTVTANAGSGTMAVSNAGLTELAAAINASSQMDVNIAASNATITVASHAVTNAGTFATQLDGAALTALQLIDDPVATLGTTTYTETTTKGMTVGAVRRDADTTLVDTTNEIGPLQMDANGRLKVEAFSGETLPVSLASVPSHAVTNAGTFAVQVDGSALTALQLIDDTVFADDAAYTLGTSKSNVASGIAVQTDGTDPTAVSAEGDAAALRTDMQRNLIVNQTHPRFWHVSADYASAQTNTSVKTTPGASLSLYITDLTISNGATAGNITLLDGSGGTVLYEIYPAINGGSVMTLRSPIKLTANTALCITSTSCTTHSIFVSGYIAP